MLMYLVVCLWHLRNGCHPRLPASGYAIDLPVPVKLAQVLPLRWNVGDPAMKGEKFQELQPPEEIFF